MNFNIVIDKEKNVLTITIILPTRRVAKTPRKKVGYRTMKKLLDENLKLPKNYTLGECINPHLTVDNSPDTSTKAAWSFNLLPSAKPSKKKVVAPKKTVIKSQPSLKKKKTKKPVEEK